MPEKSKHFENIITVKVITIDRPLSELSKDELVDALVYGDIKTIEGPISVTSSEIDEHELNDKLKEFEFAS